MRAVIKKVSAAGVTIKNDLMASIDRGLCVLVGFHKDDTEEDVDYVISKVLNSKLFSADGEKNKVTVVDEGLEILCVSQPTLFAVVRENGLQYPDAMADELSAEYFGTLVATLRKLYGKGKVKESTHGDYMEVHFDNDGAVTLMLDSRDR